MTFDSLQFEINTWFFVVFVKYRDNSAATQGHVGCTLLISSG